MERWLESNGALERRLDVTGLIFIENFLKVVLLSRNGGQMVKQVVREIRVSWKVAPI